MITSPAMLEAMMIKAKNTVHVRGTMYDVLVCLPICFFLQDEQHLDTLEELPIADTHKRVYEPSQHTQNQKDNPWCTGY